MLDVSGPGFVRISEGIPILPMSWNRAPSWSRFKALTVSFVDQPAFSFVRPQNWDDTMSYRLGANHTVSTNWDIRLGVLYEGCLMGTGSPTTPRETLGLWMGGKLMS